ncbi:MAG TPA: hypothetical protein VGI65_19325 [Steroidobacteraceae bacterium]
MEIPINPWQALQRSVATKLWSEPMENPRAKGSAVNAQAAASWLARARSASPTHHQSAR